MANGRSTPQLELEVGTGPDGPVVVVRGELDAFTCGEFEECLSDVVAKAGAGDVVLAVAELELIDSMCLAVLVRAQQRLAAQGGRVVLESPTALVRQVLDVTGLTEVFVLR